MDDLDHSVLIAEQDWDCFCVESEECSVQQAKLADLDESGFSDTDDEKTSSSTSLPISTSPDQICEKEGQKQHQIGECKIKHSSEKCELTAGYPSPESEPQYSEQMSNVSVNEEEYQNKSNEYNTGKLRENDGNGENKVSEVTTTDIKHSTDGIETLTDVRDSSPAAIKEKERWFVTVNDSPVRLRVKDPASVQKKRRKKKRSKNLRQNSGGMENSTSLNTKTESEITERQTACDKSEQVIVSSDSPNIQNVQIQDISSTESSEDEEEKTSCVLGLKKESMAEIPKAKLERNPADSPNSLLTPKQLPQMIFKDLTGSLPQNGDHDKYDKSIEDVNCECDNLSLFNNDAGTESLGFILGDPKPTDTPSLDTEQQEPLGESDNSEESSQKTQSFETPGPTPPIFAISSFWDEMEKLTINDILQLRIANNKSLLTESIIPEESSPLEVVDAHLLDRGEVESKDESLEDGLVDDMADSDYFTHLDDSKPDRSSCEFSTFSDFDDEFIQLLRTSANPSPDPVESKEQIIEETCQSKSNGIVKLFPEGDPLSFMYSETEMEDLFVTTKEDNKMSAFLLDRCNMRRSTPSPVLSVSDILEDQCLLSIFEVSKNVTELEQYQTWIPSRNASLGFSQNISLAETYDEFFSDFEVENFPFSSSQSSTKSEKMLVPIYSSSRSVVKDLELPEVDEMMQSNGEIENTPIRVMSPSETSYMCFITSQRSTWRNLSLRHTTLLMGRTWCRMASSWGLPKSADIVYNYETKTTSSSSVAQPNLPVLLLDNPALGQMSGHQIHVGGTVADSALLANVSAISAIQYLRRYVKEG